MARSFLRRLRAPDADDILHDLTTRQHLLPHRPVGEVLAASAVEIGFCTDAAARAVEWLKLDRSSAIGRLRRSELAQLSLSIYRFWRQARAAEASQSQPA